LLRNDLHARFERTEKRRQATLVRHSRLRFAMKCQQCEKPATFHITELTGGQPQELHLCETCAKTYLMSSDAGAPAVAPTLANVLAKQLKLGQAAKWPSSTSGPAWRCISSSSFAIWPPAARTTTFSSRRN
jgi:hypothetical protein